MESPSRSRNEAHVHWKSGRRHFFVRVAVLVAAPLLVSRGYVLADVRLPHIISEHVVLQREMPIRIWGWADAREPVTVKLGKLEAATIAGDDRHWEVQLPATPAGGPYELTVEGTNKLTIADVWIGEVWFCAGQSNMALGVVKSLDHEREIRAADYPRIRFVTTPQSYEKHPVAEAEVHWQVCSPQTVSYFSATAYYFGRELHRELDVPVGLIVSAVNGTRIEPWTPAADHTLPHAELKKKSPDEGELFNAMVHPFTPHSVRGVIWYQGEGNVGDGLRYCERMESLVEGWRKAWGFAELPFYYVQIAPLNWGGKPRDQHAELWEAQTAALRIPNTGMVVTNDIGNPGDAHPKNKQEVGRRLARWALARTYGKDVAYSGPIYRSMRVERDQIRIEFDYADSGLTSRDGAALNWFTIAGEDGVFAAAQAEIEGETIVVSNPRIKRPVAVRFAWDQAAEPNLMNKAGLPASAFRTDGPLARA